MLSSKLTESKFWSILKQNYHSIQNLKVMNS